MISEENIHLLIHLIPFELLNTLYMVFASTFFGALIGIPLGVILAVSDRGGIKPNVATYNILNWVVDITRSIPFAILMIAIIPFTRFIVGTSLGTTASIVPLSIAAAPFLARIVEASLKMINREIIEAAQVMGSSNWNIICKVFLPESFPSLISGITLTIVNVIGYTAMAGLVGGGGLGKIAIQYGYNRFNGFIMLVTVVLLLILVLVIQLLGNRLERAVLFKRGKKLL